MYFKYDSRKMYDFYKLFPIIIYFKEKNCFSFTNDYEKYFDFGKS